MSSEKGGRLWMTFSDEKGDGENSEVLVEGMAIIGYHFFLDSWVSLVNTSLLEVHKPFLLKHWLDNDLTLNEEVVSAFIFQIRNEQKARPIKTSSLQQMPVVFHPPLCDHVNKPSYIMGKPRRQSLVCTGEHWGVCQYLIFHWLLF